MKFPDVRQTSDSGSWLKLGWTFLRIGAMAFGGLGATLALLEVELVERQKVASKHDLTEALTYTKLLPGSTVVQVVAYLGWRLAGWRGSGLATAAFLLPSAALMTLLAHGYARLPQVPVVVAVQRGVLSAVVALLLLTMWRLAQSTLRTAPRRALAVAAFGVVMAPHVSAVWVVLAAGALGVAVKWWERRASG